VLLFEVVNRGNILLLNKFNSAASSRNPTTTGGLRQRYLMREGYTLVFVGWEFDLAPGIIRGSSAEDRRIDRADHGAFILDSRQNETELDDAPLYARPILRCRKRADGSRSLLGQADADRAYEMAFCDRTSRGAARGA
jgi:hypothetical protein